MTTSRSPLTTDIECAIGAFILYIGLVWLIGTAYTLLTWID
jgi:hypothetical protein